MLNHIFTAIKEVSKNLFRKPNTIIFPKEHVQLPNDFRGAPRLIPENCTLCGRCERICPTAAIEIGKISKNEAHFIIDLGKCCYCQECEDTCKFDAIHLTQDWLTSELHRKELITEFYVFKESNK